MDNTNQQDNILPYLLDSKFFLPFETIMVSSDMFLDKNIIQELKQDDQIIIATIVADTKNIDIEIKNLYYDIGSLATIKKIIPLSNGEYRYLCKIEQNIKLNSTPQNQFMQYWLIEQQQTTTQQQTIAQQTTALLELIKHKLKSYYFHTPEIKPQSNFAMVLSSDDINIVIKYIFDTIITKTQQQYKILNHTNQTEQLKDIFDILQNQVMINLYQQNIQEKLNLHYDKKHQENYLKDQIVILQKELGKLDPKNQQNKLEKFKKQYNKIKKYLNKHDKHMLKNEIDRLAIFSHDSQEYSWNVDYLETIFSIPFGKYTKSQINIKQLDKQLNKKHYGLKEPKDAILEYFAAKQLVKQKNIKNKNNSNILCFVGPPGIGKTSLAQSIAKALKRKIIRISLGGMQDIHELKGHRKTYIAATIGKIAEALVKTKCSDPVIVFDEIDKVSSAHNQAIASVLLEILDPEQNSNFVDFYLNLSIDLSNIFFIATANDKYSILPPLRDRIEFIELSSYTLEEKYNIAKNYIIPLELKKNGFNQNEIIFKDQAIRKIIDDFTLEAGVRNLKRVIRKIIRKIAFEILYDKNNSKTFVIEASKITKYLNTPIVQSTLRNQIDQVGVVNGLSWTSVGGDILRIEAIKIPNGNGKIILTGSLGEVIKESATISYSLIQSIIYKKDTKKELQKKVDFDIHIHFPEGAIPKDGPSAGIALSLVIASLLTNKKIKSSIAMTGEITLTGDVLAIGGLKEKLIAAHKAKIKTVLIPKANYKTDLKNIPQETIDALQIKAVSTIKEVLQLGLI